MSPTTLRKPTSTIASYLELPRLQERTSRSFVGEAPPDPVAVWLMAEGFRPLATSANAAEYGRFGFGPKGDDGKPAQIAVLYWGGSLLCQGRDYEALAERLRAICEPTPAQACMFDLLDAERAPRTRQGGAR